MYGKHMATNPTHPPTPLCFFPVVSLVDGHRQKGHEPGCGFSKLFYSLYHQGLVPSWELQSGSACLFPHIPISSQALAAERVSQCKPLWRWLLLCENVCCVLFARFQLESTMGFLWRPFKTPIKAVPVSHSLLHSFLPGTSTHASAEGVCTRSTWGNGSSN